MIDPELLRVARVLAHMSHRELARRVGVSVWRLGRVEAGVSPMREQEHVAFLRELPLLAKLEREHTGTGDAV